MGGGCRGAEGLARPSAARGVAGREAGAECEANPSRVPSARFHIVGGNSLLASVFIGSVGMGLFVYGKRQQRVPHLAVGILLMVYPYFVPGLALMLVIAAALLGLLGLASYLGL